MPKSQQVTVESSVLNGDAYNMHQLFRSLDESVLGTINNAGSIDVVEHLSRMDVRTLMDRTELMQLLEGGTLAKIRTLFDSAGLSVEYSGQLWIGDLENKLRTLADGTEFCFSYERGNGSGHMISGVKHAGGIELYDAQIGRLIEGGRIVNYIFDENIEKFGLWVVNKAVTQSNYDTYMDWQPASVPDSRPHLGVDFKENNFPDVFSVKQLKKNAMVLMKRAGNGYRNIVSELERFWASSEVDQARIAMKIDGMINNYVKNHDGSRRNAALLELGRQIQSGMDALHPVHGLDQFAVDDIRAEWNLYHIKNGKKFVDIRERFETFPDGTSSNHVFNQGEQALYEQIQSTIDHDEMRMELDAARSRGVDVRSQAGLSGPLEDSIKWYTSTGYQYINEALRNGVPLVDFVKSHGENIISALNMLPKHEGVLYRALAVDDLPDLAGRIVPGELIGDKGFLSTSVSREFVKSFRGGRGTVIYIIENSKNGRNVSGYAQLHQGEVLLPPGSIMRVKHTRLTESNLIVVLDGSPDIAKMEVVRNLADGLPIGVTSSRGGSTLLNDVKTVFDQPFGNSEVDRLCRHERSATQASILDSLMWQEADVSKLTAHALNDESRYFKYSKQFIIQADGDGTVFDATNALFSKHPKNSEWIQLRNGELHAALSWDAVTNQVQKNTVPFSIEQDGSVRLMLIGRGIVDAEGGVRFAGKNAEQWKSVLTSMFEKLPSGKVKSLRLDLVGCSLADGKRMVDTLPGQLAQWLEGQAKARGWSGGVSMSARQGLVSVDSAGKKWVFETALGWVNKEDMKQRGARHKVEWTWDAVEQKLIEPVDIRSGKTLIQDSSAQYDVSHSQPLAPDSRPHLGGNQQGASASSPRQIDTQMTALTRANTTSELITAIDGCKALVGPKQQQALAQEDGSGQIVRERRPSQNSAGGDAEAVGRPQRSSEEGSADEGGKPDVSPAGERKPISDAGDTVTQPKQDEPSHRNALEQLAATQLDGERLSQRWFAQVEALKRKNRLGAEWEAVGGIETDADGTAKQRFVNTQDGSDTRLAIPKKHQQLFNDFAAYTKEQAKQIRLQRRENIRDAVGGVFGLAMNTFSLVQTLRDVNPMNQGLGVLGRVPRTPVEIAAQVQVYTQLVQTPVSYVDDGKQLLDAIRALRGGAVKSSMMFGKVVPVVSLVLDTVNLAAMATEFHNEKDPERRKILAANIGVSVIGSGLAIAGLTAGALAASSLVSVAVAAAAAAAASAIGWIALPVAAVGMATTYAVQYFSGQAEKFNEVKKEFDLLFSDIRKKGFSKRDGVWQVGTGVVSELNFLTGKMRYGRVRVTPTTVTGLSRPGGMDHVRSHAMERGGTPTMDEQIEIERKGVSPELYQRMRARDISMLDVYDAFGVEKDKEYDHEIGDVDSAILLPSNPDVDLVLTVGAVADKRYVDAPAFKALRDKYGERFVWMFHQWGIGTDYSFTGVASEFTRKNVVVTLDAKARTLIVPALQGKQVGYMKYTLRGNGGAYALVLSSSLPEIYIEASSQATELWTIDISQVSHQYVGAITAAGAAVEYQKLANKAAQNGNTLSAAERAEYNLYRERMGQKYFAPRRNVFAALRIMREQVSFGGQKLNLDGGHAPRLMLVDNVADGIRLQLVLDFSKGTKVSASIYIDEDSPLDSGEFNKLLQYFSWSGLDKYLRYHSSEVLVRGKWSGSLNISSGTGFLIRDQSRLWNGSEEHEILWIKDRETAPYRSSIPGAIEQVTKLEDRYRLSGSFTPPTGLDKGRFVFETPRLADIRRAELGALPGLQCRELHMGRHPGFFNSLLNGWDWRPRWQRPDAAQLARHVREDFPTFYGEFSEGAVIEGVNEQGQTLQLYFVNGGLELRAASWQRDGATYHYLDEAGSSTWYLVEGGMAETVSLLESDLQTLPLRHHESPAVLLRLTAATHTLRVSEYWQNIAPISIILADRPGLNIIVDGHKNLLRWERDGNDVLLMNRGKTVLKLLDALSPGQRLALAYTQLQFDGVTVSLQDVLAQREQCDAAIREISPRAQGLEDVRQRLAPLLRTNPGQVAWQEVSLPAVTSIGSQTQRLMSGVSLRQGDEPAVWLDEGVQINAEWLERLLGELSGTLAPRASASEHLVVKVYGKGVVGFVDMTRRQSYIADSAKSRTWINGHVVAGELAPVWLAGSVPGYRGKHALGQFIASGRDSRGWQLQELNLVGNSAFLSLLRELRVGNQAQVLADWLQRNGFEGRFAIGGMIEGVNAQGQRLRYRVGERIELISAEWQREGLQQVYQKQADGSWSYLIEGGAARRVTIHARDLQLPARGDGNVTTLLKLTAETRELVLEDGSVPGGLSIWQPAGEGLTLHCAGRREDWQWRQDGYDVVLQRNGQPEIRWLNLRKPHVNKQKPRALWTHENFADYEAQQEEKNWSGAQLQFDGQRVGLAEFIGAVSGSVPTPDLGQPAVLTVDGEDQERVTLRAGDIVLPEQEGPKPVQLYLGKATKQVLVANDWPEDAPIYLASTAEQPLAVQWLGQLGDMHWMRDADDLVLMQGGREKLRWQELLAADRQVARQHASLQWGGARLALTDYPPTVQIANGMLFGRDADSGRLTIWLAPASDDDAWDEVQRYFSSEEDRAILAGGLLHITGAWQGEIDVVRGKGLLVKSQGDDSIVRLWGRGESPRELLLPGQVSVWHDANGGFGFAGVRLIGYGPSHPTVRFKASGFIGQTLLADELEFDAPVDKYELFDAAEGMHADSVVDLVTAGAQVQVHAGSTLRLVNSSQQSLVLTVMEAGVALQSATWQRDGAAYSYRKAEDGTWVCRVDSGKEAKIELQQEDLLWLPATDHQGLRTELSVSAATRELVLSGDYGCVTLAQADWTGLTVQWTGSADNLSWRRVGDNLQLLQREQVKIQWQGLSPAKLAAGRCRFGLAGRTIDLINYPPQSRVAEGVMLAGSVEEPEVWISETGDAQATLKQIWDYFAAEERLRPQSGSVLIRGQWNGELDLTRGLALLDGFQTEDEWCSERVVLKWRSNGVSSQSRIGSMEGEVWGEVVRHESGQLRYQGVFESSQLFSHVFQFVAEESSGLEAGAVTLREIRGDGLSASYFSDKLGSRREVMNALNALGCGFGLADGALITLKMKQGATREYLVLGERVELKRVERADGQVCGHSADLLRQAMCSLHAAGDGESVLPNPSRHKEELSLTLPI